MPLSVCFFAFREQKGVTTDLGTDPTLVRLILTQTMGYVNRCFPVVVGSLKHDLPKLRELRVFIRLLERHWRWSLTRLNLQLCFLPGSVETEANAYDPILRLREV